MIFSQALRHLECRYQLRSGDPNLLRAQMMRPRTVAMDPFDRAMLACMQRKHREVPGWIELARRIYGESAYFWFSAGITYALMEHPYSARAALDRCVQQRPDKPAFQYFAGCLALITGDLDHGKRSLEAALKLRPDYLEAVLERAAVACLENDRGRALKLLDVAREIHGQDSERMVQLRKIAGC